MNPKGKQLLSKTILRVILWLVAIVIIIPLGWTIIQSFKTTQEFFGDVWALPASLHVENYVNAWEKANMGQYFLNSILVTVLGVLFSLCLAVPAAYCLSRYKFRGSKIIMFIFTAGLFIQATYVLVPLFSLRYCLDYGIRLYCRHLDRPR